MNDTTTQDPKPYVTGTRREFRSGRYRYSTITHRAGCPNSRWMRDWAQADRPRGEIARCCRDRT